MTIPMTLAPVFVQVALTFVLLILLGRARVGALRSGVVKLRDVALSNEPWPAPVKQLSGAYANQFETPVLFYALTAFAIATRKNDLLFVVMAWIYVALRIAHALVYTTTNVVTTRFYIFLAGVLTLMAMWVIFALRILLA